MAKSNPEFFDVRIRDGTLTGICNPAGFGADQVRRLLATHCNSGKLGSDGEQARNGLMTFGQGARRSKAAGLRSRKPQPALLSRA